MGRPKDVTHQQEEQPPTLQRNDRTRGIDDSLLNNERDRDSIEHAHQLTSDQITKNCFRGEERFQRQKSRTLSWHKNKRFTVLPQNRSSHSTTASTAFERKYPGCGLVRLYVLRVLFWDILISVGDVASDFLQVKANCALKIFDQGYRNFHLHLVATFTYLIFNFGLGIFTYQM